MTVQSNGIGPSGRSPKRFLSPSEKYEIWVSLMRGEYTISEAADRSGVDRSTVMKLRSVARQGALDALAAQSWAFAVGAGEAMVDVDAFGAHAERLQAVAVGGQILLVR
jgi:transposase-like protein